MHAEHVGRTRFDPAVARARRHAVERYLRARRTRVRRATHPSRNVVGVGLGIKCVGGRAVGRPCVTVYVERKLPPGRVPRADRIVGELDGVETDVVAVGRFRRLGGPAPSFPAPVDPIRPGCSLGSRPAAGGPRVAGTLGAIVTDVGGGRRHVLSNNHVLAGENALPLGWPVVQPGPHDGGAGRVVATLADFAALQRAGNLADVAVAELADGVRWTQEAMVPEATLVSGAPVLPYVGQVVRKVGRSSGHTTGFVVSPSATIRVDGYAQGTLEFVDQVLVERADGPFARVGDSGSLVTDYFLSRPVGLLFSTSDVVCAASRVDIALGILGVELRP
ncbi:MAG: hypothetical protein U1E39_02200 [Planctomycetota bacterium]